MQQQAVEIHPALANSSALSGTISETHFSDDIEKEANSYYQQVQLSKHCWYQNARKDQACIAWLASLRHQPAIYFYCGLQV